MKKIKDLLSLKAYLSFLFLLVFALSIFVFLEKTKHSRIVKDLQIQIERQAEAFSGDFSLAIYKPGFIELDFVYKPDERIVAASLIKIPILAAALEAVNNQQIDLNQRVEVSASDVVGGSGILRRIDLPVKMTFETLLVYMMAISDNTATNKVIDLLGFENINQAYRQFGLTNTILTRKMMDFARRSQGFENYTSSGDVNVILKKIYQKRLCSKELSQWAKNLLLLQQHRDRIPLLLPEGVLVAHKTGLERGVVHDAGIVYGENSDFIISVLTENVEDYSEAKKFIAELSYLAYNLIN